MYTLRRWAERLALFCVLLAMAGLGASPAHASSAKVDVAAFASRPGAATMTATGKVGDVVKVTVGIYNKGPGKVQWMGFSQTASTWAFTLPPGTETVPGPPGETPLSGLSKYDLDRCVSTSGRQTSDGEQEIFGAGPYACSSRASLEPGAKSEAIFHLKINKVIPNTTGVVTLDGDLKSPYSGEKSLADSNPDNDEASVIINPDPNVAAVGPVDPPVRDGVDRHPAVPIMGAVLGAALLLLLTIGVGLFLYVRRPRNAISPPAVLGAMEGESGTVCDVGRAATRSAGMAPSRPTRAGGSHRRQPGRLGVLLASRRSRRYLAAASVLVLLLASAIVLLTGGQSPQGQSPETVVRDFYTALAARDAGAARALVFPQAVYGSDATLLTDTTLRNPGYTPPANARVTRLPPPTTRGFRKGEEGAAVQADFELAGTARQARVTLARGGVYGDMWLILDPLGGLTVTSPVRDGLLSFAGTPYPQSGRDFVAFPGAYRATLAEHPLFEADPVTAFAYGGPSVDLAPRVRADARQEIDRQIRIHLDACAGSRDVNPARCPLQMLYVSQPSAARISRTITRYPTVLVELSSAVDYPLAFRTDIPGEIQVSVRTSPTSPPTITRKETLVVSGRVVLKGSAIVVEPDY
ncbi:hypothetical protein KBX37_33235 [Micromonospora sp. U56]|nr:hypothetical protein [Micromonospora sp. U56]